jgi:ubiquinone biosynthesis protein Coq4
VRALFPEKSIGYGLYRFLTKYQFSLISKAENHDVAHVITQIGVSPLSEIKMQYLLLGNGKRSPYLFICIFAGLLFYPSHVKHFYSAYARGKQAMPFHRIDFKNCLHMPVADIRKSLNIN